MKVVRTMMLTIGFFMMVLISAGCQHKAISPTQVTKQFLDGYHAKNEEAIKQNSEWTAMKDLYIQDKDYINGVDKTLQKEVYAKIFDFKYSEADEKIKGDHASVKAEITVYNFEPEIEKGVKEATANVEVLSKENNLSDAKTQATIMNILFENMKDAKMDKKKRVEINLVKKDHVWKVAQDNQALKDALDSNTKTILDFKEKK